MLGANFQYGLQHSIDLANPRRLCSLLDQDGCERGHPLEQPVIVALAQERLQEVRQSLEILLVLVVVRDVVDYRVSLLASSFALVVCVSVWLLGLEDVAAVLTQGLQLRLLLRLREEAGQCVFIFRVDLLDLVGQVELVYIVDDHLKQLIVDGHTSLLRPDGLLSKVLFPEKDGVFETRLGTLASEEYGVWNLERLGQAQSHKFLDPLHERILKVRKTH